MAGWKRLAKATADGTSSTLSVSFDANDVIRLQIYAENTSGAGNFQIRFNNDTTANRHKTRRVYDGAGTSGNRYDDYSSNKFISYSATSALQSYMIIDVHNIDNEEHLVMGNCVESGATGAGSTGVPHTVNWMGKYTEKTPQVTSVQLITNSNNLNDKSYIIVLTTADNVVTDEKTTIGDNVELGTRFYETDTRKIYTRKYATGAFTPSWVERGTAGSMTATLWSCADTSAMMAGGTTSAWTANNATQTWNGTSWSGASNLTASRELLDGGGNASDYISVAGDSGGAGSPQDDVYKWNGSSWSSGGTISSNSFMLSAGGDTTDALWCGGNNGSSAISTAQTYDGSSWTAISSMSDTRRGHAGDGTSSDFLAVGGYDDGSSTQRTAIEAWNGTSWSAGTAYNGSNGSMYGYGGGAGRTSSFIAQTNQRSQSNTYTYNGSAWALTNNSTGGSVNYSALGGDSGNTIKGGGADGSSWAVNTSEKFDGTNWTATNNLNTGISTGGMGGNN